MINARLGTWKFPSGNSCTLWGQYDAEHRGRLYVEWDSPPPLSAIDVDHLINVVIPAVGEWIGFIFGGGLTGKA